MKKLIIVAARFNEAVTDAMVAFAEDEAGKLGAKVLRVVRVPGTYELPLPLQRALKEKKVDAAVVLGAIERGETLHGEVMGQVVSRAVVDLSLRFDKPVGLGIIGPGATHEQMKPRAELHARNAVRAVMESLQPGKTPKQAPPRAR